MLKDFQKKHINVHQYEPKSFRLRHLKVGDDYDIEGFKQGKFKGLKEFYGKYLGIKDKKIPNAANPNYYEFKLKGENDGVFLVKNWRKELGTQDADTTKQDFMESYKRMIEKDEPIDLGDKKIKMKGISYPKKEKEKIKIQPVVKEVMDDIIQKVEAKEEKEEKPKTIRIKKQKKMMIQIKLN